MLALRGGDLVITNCWKRFKGLACSCPRYQSSERGARVATEAMRIAAKRGAALVDVGTKFTSAVDRSDELGQVFAKRGVRQTRLQLTLPREQIGARLLDGVEPGDSVGLVPR